MHFSLCCGALRKKRPLNSSAVASVGDSHPICLGVFCARVRSAEFE